MRGWEKDDRSPWIIWNHPAYLGDTAGFRISCLIASFLPPSSFTSSRLASSSSLPHSCPPHRSRYTPLTHHNNDLRITSTIPTLPPLDVPNSFSHSQRSFERFFFLFLRHAPCFISMKPILFFSFLVSRPPPPQLHLVLYLVVVLCTVTVSRSFP